MFKELEIFLSIWFNNFKEIFKKNVFKVELVNDKSSTKELERRLGEVVSALKELPEERSDLLEKRMREYIVLTNKLNERKSQNVRVENFPAYPKVEIPKEQRVYGDVKVTNLPSKVDVSGSDVKVSNLDTVTKGLQVVVDGIRDLKLELAQNFKGVASIFGVAGSREAHKITDGSKNSTLTTVGSNVALDVNVVQTVGGSGGGGTQYTEGDTDTTITGTAMLVEGAGNSLVVAQGTVADGILVNLGSNNDVTVTGSVTANAGTNLNTSLLALEAGGNLAAVATSLGLLDNSVDGNYLNANMNLAGTDAPTGGGTESGVLRVTMASDSTGVLSVDDNGSALTVDNGGTFVVQESGAALTALQLIDDVIYTDDTSTHTPASTKVTGIGAVATPTDTALTANDIGMPGMSVGRELWGIIRDAAGNLRGANVSSNNELTTQTRGAVDTTARADNISNTADGYQGTGGSPIYQNIFPFYFDGSTWDRVRGDATDGLLVNLGSNNDITNGGTFVVQENGAALTALQLIDDSVATTGSAIPAKGLAVSGTDGTNARVLKTDASGELQVDVNSVVPGTGATNLGKAIDTATGATDTGVLALGTRDDALTTLTPADGDNVTFRTNSLGALWVNPIFDRSTSTSLTVTNLNSLASSATAGWQSVRIDNTSTRYRDFQISVKISFANTSPANDKAAYVLISPAYYDGSAWFQTDGGTATLPGGSEGTYTIANPNNLRTLGVLAYTTADMVTQGTWNLSSAVGANMPDGFQIIIINFTGAAIDSSGNVVQWKGII